jgi:trimethylamine--corrinoid protein Co-methyltransferase
MAGANVIYGLGMIGQGITFDYSKLMMDVEIARMINKVIEGIPINDETLALEVIKAIGPGGEYVSCDHTYKYYKTVPSQPKLISKTTKEAWIEKGSKTFTERGYEAAIKIIEGHKPVELPAETLLNMRRIVNEAERHYGVEISEE